MSFYSTELTINSSKKREAIDVTDLVSRAVTDAGVKEGLCILFVPHTTSSIVANEHFDPNVGRDITDTLDRLVPQDGKYGHPEGNAPAHIKSSMCGASLTVPVRDGKLMLGQWQGLFFMEFDGPRARRLIVTLMR